MLIFSQLEIDYILISNNNMMHMKDLQVPCKSNTSISFSSIHRAKYFKSDDNDSGSTESQQDGGSPEATQDAVKSILAIVGGEASFKALMTWASQNLTAEQLQGLKRVLESGNMAEIKEMLLAIQKEFIESKSYENYRLF